MSQRNIVLIEVVCEVGELLRQQIQEDSLVHFHSCLSVGETEKHYQFVSEIVRKEHTVDAHLSVKGEFVVHIGQQ